MRPEDVPITDLATLVRSKNAGPFWVTMELFMRDADGYRIVADEGMNMSASPFSRANGANSTSS